MAIVLGVMLLLHKVGIYKESNLSFKGVVQKVTYSINKGTPTITVDSVEYGLYGGIDFKYQIEVGDSISKRKGERRYELIKKNTEEVIVFEH